MDCRRFSFLLPSCCVITLALGASYTNAQASTVTVTPVKDVAIASARPASVAKPKLPAEMPATPPQVTCVGDQLTIVANNSTMASVFASLHKCIGVAIDLPSGFSTSRVFAELGPGPVNQVLQSLLSSTDLDYVIQLSSTDSTKVQAVILTARVDEVKDSLSSPELTSTPARRAWLETRHNARRTQEESESSALTESQASAGEVPDASPIAQPSQDIPATAVAANPDAAPNSAPAQPGSALPSGAATGAPDSSVAPSTSATTAPADPNSAPAPDPNAPPPVDQSNVSPADKETQDKITNMEQLFEKRRQMTEAPSSAPKQQ